LRRLSRAQFDAIAGHGYRVALQADERFGIVPRADQN
jgi:hypothetical protein